MINYDFSHQLTLGKNARDSTRSWNERAHAFYHREQAEDYARDSRAGSQNRRFAIFSARRARLPGHAAICLRGRSMIRYAVARWSLRARRGGDLTASLASLEYTEMLRLLEKRGLDENFRRRLRWNSRRPFPQPISPRRSRS